MNHFLKKILLILPISLLFIFLSETSLAAGTVIRVSCPSVNGQTVTARKASNGYVIGIPGSWDPSALIVSVDGGDCFYLDDRQYSSQEPCDLSPYLGKDHSWRNGNKKRIGKVTVRQGSEIPAIFLELDATQLKQVNNSKENIATEGTACLTNSDGTVALECGISHFKGRGNSTFAYKKKPYELKLTEKGSVDGMAENKTWILLANYLDVSMLRNEIVLNLSADVGLPYALECRPVDLWLNGEYNGLYLMTEKVQIKKDRLELADLEEKTQNINEDPLESYPRFAEQDTLMPQLFGYEIPNDPGDITGGYIAVIEKPHRLTQSKKPGFRTDGLLSVRIKEPTCPTRNQVTYLAELVNDMHHAILADDGRSEKTGKYYAEYMDIPSFARKFLIEDLTKNYDAVSGSQFFFKDSDSVDGLLYAGPSWDYDLCCGNMDARGQSTAGDYAAKVTVGPCNLYKQLARHPDFMEEVARAWREDFRPALAVLLGEAEETENLKTRSIEAYKTSIEASANMNEKRWGTPMKYVSSVAGKTFDQAINRLKTWLTKRIAYMDERYGK